MVSCVLKLELMTLSSSLTGIGRIGGQGGVVKKNFPTSQSTINLQRQELHSWWRYRGEQKPFQIRHICATLLGEVRL